MKEVIKYFLASITSSKLSLEKKSVLIDKPWALIDEEGEIQKLIFERDNGLILSKDGKVTQGSWKYFPEAKALFIDRGSDKILLKEQYIDENVMLLKQDGTKDVFYALANENTIPNYNVINYLNDVKFNECMIRQVELADGKYLLIHNASSPAYKYYNVNDLSGFKAEIADKSLNVLPFASGVFLSSNKLNSFYLENFIITKVTSNLILKTIDNKELFIENTRANSFIYDALNLFPLITLQGQPVKDETILLYDKSRTLYFKDGKLIDFSRNVYTTLSDGTEILIENGDIKHKENLNKKITINGRRVKHAVVAFDESIRYVIEEGLVSAIKFHRKYKLSKKFLIIVDQKDSDYLDTGDVIINSEPLYPIPDGNYRIKGTLRWIRIKDNIIN